MSPDSTSKFLLERAIAHRGLHNAALGQPENSRVAFRAAAEAAAAAVDPMSDHNTSADYRRDLVGTLTVRALERASTGTT